MKWTAKMGAALALALGLAGCGDKEPARPKKPEEKPETPPAAKAETQPAAKPKAPATGPVTKPPAAKQPTMAVKPGCKKFVDKDRGYAVQYPQDWQVSKPMFKHQPVLFLRPRKVAPKAGQPKEFRENFNVVSRKRSKPADLKTSHERQMKLLKMQMPGLTVTGSEDLTVNGRPVKKDIVTAKAGKRKLKIALYMLVSDSAKQLYVLTASAPEETFDQYASVFQAAVDTLEILAE